MTRGVVWVRCTGLVSLWCVCSVHIVEWRSTTHVQREFLLRILRRNFGTDEANEWEESSKAAFTEFFSPYTSVINGRPVVPGRLILVFAESMVRSFDRRVTDLGRPELHYKPGSAQ